jgi:hypothetical protein
MCPVIAKFDFDMLTVDREFLNGEKTITYVILVRIRFSWNSGLIERSAGDRNQIIFRLKLSD